MTTGQQGAPSPKPAWARGPAARGGTAGPSVVTRRYRCRKNASSVMLALFPRICGFCIVMLPLPSM